MPFRDASQIKKLTLRLQHTMLPFRNFYTQQAAKALFGSSSLIENASLARELKRSMDLLTITQIKHTDRAVIVNAKDTIGLLKTLKVKALALKGEDDYVPAPPYLETIIVKGGHVSPIENPEEVSKFINKLLQLYCVIPIV